MTDTSTPAPAKTPWHLWVVGVLTLLWNGYGGYDYYMTESNNAGYMAMFTEEQRTYFASLPAWEVATWAVGVWGGVLGSILLLLRSKFAVIVYAIALAGLIVSYVYLYGMTDGVRITGQMTLIMSAIIALIAIGELVYSWWASGKGVLR